MTLRELYAAVTGDTTAHHSSIAARTAKLDARRRRIIKARLSGKSLRDIGELEKVTVGSVQSAINGAMKRVYRELHQQPRYSVSREGMGGRKPPEED
jgi:DNA-directed RNA polymerase specialized sigma24 family protein